MRWTDAAGESFSLHEACYVGRLDAVIALLDAGADPNSDAAADDRWEWISAAGPQPRPLHCVAIAWEYKPEHVEIIRRLVARGARVEDTVLQDYWIETTLTPNAIAVGTALGVETEQLDGLRDRYGETHDRYAGGKVLFVDDDE
jgi:hypothetical protein